MKDIKRDVSRPMYLQTGMVCLITLLVGCTRPDISNLKEITREQHENLLSTDLSEQLSGIRYSREISGLQTAVDAVHYVSEARDSTKAVVILQVPSDVEVENAIYLVLADASSTDTHEFDSELSNLSLQYVANSLQAHRLEDGETYWSLMYEVMHEYVSLDPFSVSVGVVVENKAYAIHGEIPSNAYNFPDRWWEFFRIRPHPSFATEQPEAYALAVERWRTYAELWLRRHEKYARKEEGIALPPSDFELIDSQRNSTVF
ncbi:MAG: hypothetical protein AAF752_05725 [Bacteroidota bacterium]